MATIVTRAGKGEPLTHTEVDANFTNLNDEAATKAPLASPTFTGDVTIADKIVHAGDTNTAIRFPAADTVTVETAGAERLRVTSAGNVGIGTNTPNNLLDVAGAAEVLARFYRTDSTLALLRVSNSTTGDGSTSAEFGSDGTNAVIHNNNAERLRVTSTGNVGIGTTSPAATLDVAGTGAIKVPVGTEAQRPTSATGLLRFNSDAASFEGYNGTEWGSIGGGATSDAIYENSATITENITLVTGRNGMSTGPITINSGVTVTVESGARYVVI
jgi:hypothetical protein